MASSTGLHTYGDLKKPCSRGIIVPYTWNLMDPVWQRTEAVWLHTKGAVQAPSQTGYPVFQGSHRLPVCN